MTASNETAAVAFYGVSADSEGVAKYYRTVVEWFTALGHPPNKLGVSGPGHSGKMASFAGKDAKLRRVGFEGVTGVEITSMMPGGTIPTNDYVASSAISLRYGYLTVACRHPVATLSEGSMLPVARSIAEATAPKYGVGYTREHHLGPEFYAIGICQGLGFSDAVLEEKSRISKWSQIGMKERVYEKGLLRDVYRWNFLNAAQRAASVDGLPLQDWIRRDSSRGILSTFTHDLLFWSVDERKCSEVREALERAGLVFDWRKYVHRG